MIFSAALSIGIGWIGSLPCMKKGKARKSMKENRLFCVIPCYNEQEVLPETSKRLKSKMQQLIADGKISPDSRVVFVNDGSKDTTW